MTFDRLRVAAFLILSLPPARAAAQQPAGADARSSARTHYHRGVQLLAQHRYAAAYAEFHSSLALVDSPNARLLEGRCLREMGQLSDAARDFAATERDAGTQAATQPRFAPTRDAAHAELDALTPRLARVHLRVVGAPAGTQIRVAGRALLPDEVTSPILVDPGPVLVEATPPSGGAAPIATHVEVAAGADTDVPLRFDDRARSEPSGAHATASTQTSGSSQRGSTSTTGEPAPGGATNGAGETTAASGGAGATTAASDEHVEVRTHPLVSTTPGLVIGGLGVVAFIAFGILYAVTDAQFHSLQTQCAPNCTNADLSGAESLGLLTDVALGVGIAGVVAGGALLAASRVQHEERVRVGFDGRGITLRVRF